MFVNGGIRPVPGCVVWMSISSLSGNLISEILMYAMRQHREVRYTRSLVALNLTKWWAMLGSNQRLLVSKTSTLSTELMTHESGETPGPSDPIRVTSSKLRLRS